MLSDSYVLCKIQLCVSLVNELLFNLVNKQLSARLHCVACGARHLVNFTVYFNF